MPLGFHSVFRSPENARPCATSPRVTRYTHSQLASLFRPHSRCPWEVISHAPISEQSLFPGVLGPMTHPTLPTSSACPLWTTLRSCLSVSTGAIFGRRLTPSGRFQQVSSIRLQPGEHVALFADGDFGNRRLESRENGLMFSFVSWQSWLSRDSSAARRVTIRF